MNQSVAGFLQAARNWSQAMSSRVQVDHRGTNIPMEDTPLDVILVDQPSRKRTERAGISPDPIPFRRGATYPETGRRRRTELLSVLDERLAHARSHSGRLAVMFIDLDHFAVVCSMVGRSTAEQILQEVRDRISIAVRAADLVAHLGSDEFVVALDGLVRGSDSGDVAARVLGAIGRRIKIAHQWMVLHASVGIALYPDDSASAESLLLQASLAMKRAKQRGRSRLAFSLPM